MAREKIITSDPYTDVDLRPVVVDGHEIDKYAAMVKDDDGNWKNVGIHSAEYNLIKNEIAENTITDVMSRSEYEWEPFKRLWDGKKFMSAHISRNAIAQVRGNVERSMHLAIMARNSYDGSCAFHIEFFAIAIECSNQFLNRNRFGAYIMRHTNSNEWDIDDAVENISAGGQRLLELAPRFNQMSQTPIDVNYLKNTRNAEIIPDTKWGEVLRNIEDDTEWGLYNSLTHVASHDIRGFSQITYGEKIGQHFLPVQRAA
jgi:hypothetical protein